MCRVQLKTRNKEIGDKFRKLVIIQSSPLRKTQAIWLITIKKKKSLKEG